MRMFIVSVFISITLSAQTKTERQPLPLIMHTFYSTLYELKPYIISEKLFSDKNNAPKVLKLIEQLEKKASGSKSPEIADTIGFSQTYELFAQHLRETKYLYERQIYGKAYNHLKAGMSYCISCHERLPKETTHKLTNFKMDSAVKAVAEDAEFYYIAHQFDQAMALYNQQIRSFKKDGDIDALHLALTRKLYFYTRIARDIDEAMSTFSEDLKNEQLPKDTKQILKSWNKSLADAKNDKNLTFDLNDTTAAIAFATEVVANNTDGRRIGLTDPSLVRLLIISSKIFQLSNKSLSDESRAELLYLMAKCERDLVSVRGFSLSDVYLKECVVKFPKSTVAKKCFSDYESSMKLKYQSGSSEYINSTIETLRKTLNRK